MPPENFFPPLPVSGDSPTFNYGAMDRLLKFRAFQQQPVVYVAASDTPEALAYMAKYKCDGTADQEELNEALATGLPVFALPGTFTLSDQVNIGAEGQTFEGFGPSTIFVPSQFIARFIYVNYDNVTVRNFKIDSSAFANNSEGVRAQACDRTFVEGIVGNDLYYGTYFGGGTLVDPTVVHSYFVDSSYGAWVAADRPKVIRCRMDNSSIAGVYLNSGGEVNNSVILSGGDGIWARGESRIIANTVRAVDDVGITLDDDDGQVVANYLTLCGTHGIESLPTASDYLITSNIVDTSSQNTDDTYDNIRIGGDDGTVTNNVSRMNTLLTNGPKYGINVISGASANYVTNNDLLNSGTTASFNDSGTGTVTTAGNRT